MSTPIYRNPSGGLMVAGMSIKKLLGWSQMMSTRDSDVIYGSKTIISPTFMKSVELLHMIHSSKISVVSATAVTIRLWKRD